MGTKRVIGVLNRLYRTVKAGELGYNTVAGIVSNRGLKILLKTFAQQRLQMADELAGAIRALGGDVSARRSFPGMVHRGRVALVGTLIINELATETAALKEATIGEREAMRRYRQVLEMDLPAATRELLVTQMQVIQETAAQINALRGENDDRLMVRLFNSQQDANKAIHAMQQDGLSLARVETRRLENVAAAYRGQTTVVSEVVLSGAVGGGIWGAVLGTIAGAGLVMGAGIDPVIMSTPQAMWAMISLMGLVSGIVVGMVLGLFIGVGFVEEDAYQYDRSLDDGDVLLMLHTSNQQAPLAARALQHLSIQLRP